MPKYTALEYCEGRAEYLRKQYDREIKTADHFQLGSLSGQRKAFRELAEAIKNGEIYGIE